MLTKLLLPDHVREERPRSRWRRIREAKNFFAFGGCACCSEPSPYYYYSVPPPPPPPPTSYYYPYSYTAPVVTTPCCPSGIPATIHVTFSSTGSCPVLDGKTFAMTWNGSTVSPAWQAAPITNFPVSFVCLAPGNVATFDMILTCVGGSNCVHWVFGGGTRAIGGGSTCCCQFGTSVGLGIGPPSSYCTCDPLNLVYGPVGLVACTGITSCFSSCNTASLWTITVTL